MKLWLSFAVLGLLCLMGCFVLDATVLKAGTIFVGANFLALSAACLFHWPQIWRKQDNGRLNPFGRVLLLPLHLLNATAYFVATRIQRQTPAHQIAHNVWLGRRMTSAEAKRQFGSQTLAVLDLTSEFAECSFFTVQRYLCLPTVDHTAPMQAQLRDGVAFIETNRHECAVYVHCALGHGRSATVAAAWLLQSGSASTVEAAINQLKSVRPGVRLNSEQCGALEIFLQALRRAK